jgi:uncharacterized protein YhbP (UPF0306 family)
MQHPAWPELINDCFMSTNFMALATNGPEGLWVNPVYFAWGDKFSLYFISQLDCKHMHNIEAKSEVSCAIYPTNQTDHVFGAYVTGTAKLLTDGPELHLAKQIYYTRVHGDNQEAIEKDSYNNDSTWHHIRIDLTGLWYFDTRYFDETRTPVPDEIWK